MSGLLGAVSEADKPDRIDPVRGPAANQIEKDIDLDREKFESEQVQAGLPLTPSGKSSKKSRKRVCKRKINRRPRRMTKKRGRKRARPTKRTIRNRRRTIVKKRKPTNRRTRQNKK